MALSRWSELSGDIEIVDTTKSFYQKFLYRATFHIPGVHLLKMSYFKFILNDNRADEYIIGDMATRIHAIVNEPYYLRSSMAWQGEAADAITSDLLHTYRTIQSIAHNDDFRVRTEGATMNVYCTDENKLLEFVTDYNLKKWLTVVARPKTDEVKELLVNKVIIVPVEQEYGYKVVLREGKYPLAMRLAVMNYLTSLEDEVHLTKSTSSYLQRTREYMGGCYFYAKDKNTVDFVRLIAPTLIADIFELRYLPAK